MEKPARFYAYTMYDCEHGCGCPYTVSRPVYDKYGNSPEVFCSKEEAETVASETCASRNDDRWRVQEII